MHIRRVKRSEIAQTSHLYYKTAHQLHARDQDPEQIGIEGRGATRMLSGSDAYIAITSWPRKMKGYLLLRGGGTTSDIDFFDVHQA